MPAFMPSKDAREVIRKADALGLSTFKAIRANNCGDISEYNAEMSRLARLVEEHEEKIRLTNPTR